MAFLPTNNPSTSDIISGLFGMSGNWLSANQDIEAARKRLANATGQDAQRAAAYGAYAQQLQGLAPLLDQYGMKGGTASTAFANASVDPTTGAVSYSFNPQSQGLFTGYMAGAQSSLDQAGTFDPQAMARDRMAAKMDILQPQRDAEDNSMFRKLQAK